MIRIDKDINDAASILDVEVSPLLFIISIITNRDKCIACISSGLDAS